MRRDRWLLAGIVAALCLLLGGQRPDRMAPACAAEPPYALVIRGVNTGPDAAWMARLAKDATVAVTQSLRLARLPYQETNDSEVANGKVDLTKPAALILPYNRALSPAEVNLITAAMDRGVALVAFHVAGEKLETRLGVKPGDFTQLQEGENLALRTDAGELPGAPASVTIAPYFRRSFTVLQPTVALASWWDLPGGADQQQPAVATSAAGAFVGFLPRSTDAPALAGLLRAILGHVAPRMVSTTLPRSTSQLGPIGPHSSLAAMMNLWRGRPEGAEPEAWEYAKQAEGLLWKVTNLVAGGLTAEAESTARQARELAIKAYWASFYSPSPDIRGVWACPWPQEGARSWDTAMTRLAQAHFNVVFPYVASAGVAYYPSAVLPRVAGDSTDYLQAAVSAGQANGVEVHARLIAREALFASRETKSALAAQHRLALNSQGKTTDWLCPTDPRNQEQLVAVATEIAMRYPVQGIQLDYFRFDDTDTCVCMRCRTEFEGEAGVKAARWPQDVVTGPLKARFLEWRQQLLTDQLRAVRTQLKAVRPDLRLSVATFPNWRTTATEIGQTPAAWAKAGLVDFLCPMDYTADLQRFQGYVDTQITQLAGVVPLAVGIGAFADNCPFDSPQQAAEQIDTARAQGATGFVIFNCNPRLLADFLPWLEMGLTRRPAPPGWK